MKENFNIDIEVFRQSVKSEKEITFEEVRVPKKYSSDEVESLLDGGE